jgi:predicted DNA binding CopG/RHH family protein
MKKKLPVFESDAGAADFVAGADLTDYDLSALRPARFEFVAKTERVNMRLPKPLLDAVKARAAKWHMPYQRFIRAVLEKALADQESLPK